MRTFLTNSLLISMTVTSLAFAQAVTPSPETEVATPTTETPEAPVWNLETAADLELEGQFNLNQNIRLRLPHSRSTTPFINLYLNLKDNNGKALDRKFSKISEKFAEEVKDLRASFFKQRITKEELDAKSLEAWNRLNTSFNELDAKHPHCNVTAFGTHNDDLSLEAGMKLQFEAPIKESADLQKAGKMEFALKISPVEESAPDKLRVTCPKDVTLDKLSLVFAQHLKAQGQFTAFTDDGQLLTCNFSSCQTVEKQSGN